MQMIQDGPFANAPEKPLRMTGSAESCRVSIDFIFDLCRQSSVKLFCEKC